VTDTRKKLLDPTDKKVLRKLAEKPGITQSELAKELGMTQPSVNGRLRKLRELGILVDEATINPMKMGLSMAIVDVVCKNPHKVVAPIMRCPYLINAFTLSGEENLRLIFVAENVSTLEALVERHLRNSPDVIDTKFNIVLSTFNVPLVAVSQIFCAKPCSRACRTCEDFKKRCLGCPAGPDYQGELFKF
jgi:DNA-binding Lrp family transcriptional regulator